MEEQTNKKRSPKHDKIVEEPETKKTKTTKENDVLEQDKEDDIINEDMANELINFLNDTPPSTFSYPSSHTTTSREGSCGSLFSGSGSSVMAGFNVAGPTLGGWDLEDILENVDDGDGDGDDDVVAKFFGDDVLESLESESL